VQRLSRKTKVESQRRRAESAVLGGLKDSTKRREQRERVGNMGSPTTWPIFLIVQGGGTVERQIMSRLEGNKSQGGRAKGEDDR